MANADPRPDKIDVGVGVFRDGAGNTPILKVMKEAEQRLVDTQVTKAYLGSAGDKRFAELLRPILLGEHAGDERIVGLQTPGGCGALRLGFELIAAANPGARVLVGTPTWPNHPPIIRAVGLEMRRISLLRARPGRDPLRGHDRGAGNGASRATSLCSMAAATTRPAPTSTQSNGREVADVCRERGLIPLVDIAYQGFGRGLDEDAAGCAASCRSCDEVIVAQSCDKNFSCYRDRVGCLFVKTGSAEATATGDGPRVPARARNVVDAARSWRGGGAHHP